MYYIHNLKESVLHSRLGFAINTARLVQLTLYLCFPTLFTILFLSLPVQRDCISIFKWLGLIWKHKLNKTYYSHNDTRVVFFFVFFFKLFMIFSLERKASVDQYGKIQRLPNGKLHKTSVLWFKTNSSLQSIRDNLWRKNTSCSVLEHPQSSHYRAAERRYSAMYPAAQWRLGTGLMHGRRK